MSAPKKYEQEFRERAVRMYRERLADCVQPPIPQAPLPSKAELPLSRYALQRTQTW